MSSGAIGDLSGPERALAIGYAVLRFVVTFAIVLTVYFLMPLAADEDLTDVLGFLIVAMIGLVAIVWWQIRSIARARFPTLRAGEGVAMALPFFLCVFAATYLLIAAADPAAFSEPLDHTDALYFTVVVFGTVGFGDITPVTSSARLLVATQVLLDLVFIALVVRVLFSASRRTISKRGTPSRPD